MEDAAPGVGASDIEKIDLLKDENDLQLSLYRPRAAEVKPAGKAKATGIIRFKVFKKNQPIPLSDVLPILEDMGLQIVSERPYKLKFDNKKSIWIQDFDMVYGHGKDLDVEKSILTFDGQYDLSRDYFVSVRYNVYNYDDYVLLDRYYTSNVIWLNVGYKLPVD